MKWGGRNYHWMIDFKVIILFKKEAIMAEVKTFIESIFTILIKCNSYNQKNNYLMVAVKTPKYGE